MIDTPKPNQDEPTTSAQPIETVLPTMKERAPTGFGLVTQMHVGVIDGHDGHADAAGRHPGEDPARPRAGVASPMATPSSRPRLAPKMPATGRSTRPRPGSSSGFTEITRPAWRRGRSPRRQMLKGIPGPGGRPWRRYDHPGAGGSRHGRPQQQPLYRSADLQHLPLGATNPDRADRADAR